MFDKRKVRTVEIKDTVPYGNTPLDIPQDEYLPMLTWADWELLQALHKERAAAANVDYGMLTITNEQVAATPPKPSVGHLGNEINALREQLKHAAAERDRALVQVTVYRKAYYNLLQALSTGPSMQAMLDAVRIIDAAVKDHENQ